MVAMDKANLTHFIEASKAPQTIKARQALAAAMVTAGATTPETAVDIRRLKSKDWGVSRGTLYALLKNSPGFARTRHPDLDTLQYYFEADKMEPYAKEQGEAHYPIDLAAVGMRLFQADKPKAPNALWEIAEEKGEIAFFTAPYRQAGPETLEQFKPLLKDYSDQLDNPLVRRLIIGVLGGIEISEREGLD